MGFSVFFYKTFFPSLTKNKGVVGQGGGTTVVCTVPAGSLEQRVDSVCVCVCVCVCAEETICQCMRMYAYVSSFCTCPCAG